MDPPSLLGLQDSTLFVEGAFIGGRWQYLPTKRSFDVFDPASQVLIGRCPECSIADLKNAVQAADRAFRPWKHLAARQRSRVLRRVYDLITLHKDDLAKIISAENGKSWSDAIGEVQMAASYFEWFSEEGVRVYGDVVEHTNPSLRTRILKTPVGVCGLITPWNFPLAMGARKVAAALAAGCTVILKSDGIAPFASNALAVILERAGIPAGVISVITALDNTPSIGLAMCESPVVKKISFTGSTRVGKLLMSQSSNTLKKLSLELGGNAAFIVFDDADLETAVSSAMISKFKNSGQTCVCANRFYVQQGIYERFSQRLVEEVNKCCVGDGKEKASTHGPLTMGPAKVVSQISDAVGKGAAVLTGGHSLPNMGENFHELTVLGEVTDTMLIMSEETFGPIAALSRFTDEEEVINRANTCDVGLASYVMTSDLARSQRVSESLECGMVAINTAVISDASAP
jgi:succinate-semialdehyde dehydrogenase / glutarate-semialdehyde dehydrogenase